MPAKNIVRNETEVGHTPAPWEWHPYGTDYILHGAHGHRPIVLDYGSCGVGPRGGTGSRKLRVRNFERCLMVPLSPDHPDARLIAAAPDLLAACQALIDAPHQEHFATRLNDEEMAGIEMIRAAIARATEAVQS